MRIVWLIPFDRNIHIKMMSLPEGMYSSTTCSRLTSNFHVRLNRWNSMSYFIEKINPCQECNILLSGIGRRKNKLLKHRFSRIWTFEKSVKSLRIFLLFSLSFLAWNEPIYPLHCSAGWCWCKTRGWKGCMSIEVIVAIFLMWSVKAIAGVCSGLKTAE